MVFNMTRKEVFVRAKRCTTGLEQTGQEIQRGNWQTGSHRLTMKVVNKLLLVVCVSVCCKLLLLKYRMKRKNHRVKIDAKKNYLQFAY